MMPSPVSRGRLLAAAAAICAVTVAVGALLAATTLHGPVEAQSLATSVERILDVGRVYADDAYGCTPSQGGWDCVVPDKDSGVAGYRVTVRPGTSCWQARLIGRNPETTAGMPRTASGCVRRRELGF